MVFAIPSPALDPSPHNGSRQTNPQFEDVANWSNLEGQSNESDLGAGEGAVASKFPRYVRKHGNVHGPRNSRGNFSDQTTVDVILIACPGADPEGTWMRNEDIRSWAWTQLRQKSNIARVLVYDHGELSGKGLKDLGRDLLGVVNTEIHVTKSSNERPIIFICHSIGGLVLKFALVEASRTSEYKSVLENAYGVTFLATPHRGSVWLSKLAYSESIKHLLGLSAPLPANLMAELRPQDATLMSINQDFKALASGLRVWDIYEELPSSLCRAGSKKKRSKVTIVTPDSATLGVPHGKVMSVGASHSGCASFENQSLLRYYLEELADEIFQADHDTQYRDLQLDQKVSIKVCNFYVSSDAQDDGKGLEAKGPVSEEDTLKSFWNGTSGASLQTALTTDELDLETATKSRTEQKARVPSAVLPTVASQSSGKNSKELRRLARSLTAFLGRSSKSKDLEMGPNVESISGASSHPSSEPGISQAKPSSLQHTDSVPSLGHPPGKDASSSLPPLQELLGPPLSSPDGSFEKERNKEASPKFTWFHMPFNNPYWVNEVFATFAKTKRWESSGPFSAKDWLSQNARARRTQPRAYFLKPTCTWTPMKKDDSAKPGAFGMNQHKGTQERLFLCFPFLQIDSYKAHLRRQNVIRQRMSQGCRWPIPANVLSDDGPLENKVIWDFLDHDTPLNCRRTLDQYGYPCVKDTRARDDDQILYKMTKEMEYTPADDSDVEVEEVDKGRKVDRYCESLRSEEATDDILDGNILMVDQLWLWAKTLFTCFPQNQGDLQEDHLSQRVDLRTSILDDAKANPQRCESTWELAALILFHSVTVLMDHSSHPDLEVFHTFEEAIGILTEMITSSFKEFRASRYRNKVDDGTELKSSSIRKLHILEDEAAESENQNNMSALLELRDIEDELSTLLYLFEEQRKQISVMLQIYHSWLRPAKLGYQQLLMEANDKVQSYKEQALEMIERTKKTRQDFDKFLDILQRQAQIDEVRLSRQQADLASTQQRSVMIFTVFTVIFLPLSFFASVFGMNTHEWGGADNLQLRTIGLIALPSSSLVIVLTLVIAWSTSLRNAIKNPKRALALVLLELFTPFYRRARAIFPFYYHSRLFVWIFHWSVVEPRRGTNERVQEDITRQYFWERNRRRRQHYEIPRRNRRNSNSTVSS